MKTITCILAMIPASIMAHESAGWVIENDRSDVLITTISTTSIAGDWCGIEPAKLTLRCDDAQLSLRIESNCKPTVSGSETAFIRFNFEVGPFRRTKHFEVLADQKPLVRYQPFKEGAVFTEAFNLSSFGPPMGSKVTISLPELDRPDRDIIFDLKGMDDAVKASGMQCGTQSLFD